MPVEKQIAHTQLDGDWNLKCTINDNGTITADTDRIQTAQLIFIRDEVREIKRAAQSAADSLNTIRHFFHALGQERLKLLVQEHHRKMRLARDRRLRWNRKRRKAKK